MQTVICLPDLARILIMYLACYVRSQYTQTKLKCQLSTLVIQEKQMALANAGIHNTFYK